MKHTLFILALITATVQTFAQSPRIKLNQITKDSLTGSVLISSPTDSGMVYSRDLFVSYGADTVLILGGDTLAATSNIISSVLSDGVTITGDGTTGSELTADTSVLATLRALSDSLANYVSTTELSDSTTNIRTDIPLIIADSLLNYVNISGTQTITGAKTFTNTLTQSGGDVNFDSGTFFVDESANRVGIGTSTPTMLLNLYSPSIANDSVGFDIYQAGGATDAAIKILSNNQAATFGIQNLNSNGFSGIEFLDYTGSSKVFAGYSSSTNEFRFNNVASGGYIDFMILGNYKIRIENDGDVVIPEAYSELISGTTRDLYIKDDGTLGYISSTVKSKININPLNNINFIYELNPVTFNYRKQDKQGNFTDEYYDKTSYGLIAEEVESVADYMVYYDETEEGNVAVGINYSELITPLLKAIQDQKTEIETLKTLITELSNRLQILENN